MVIVTSSGTVSPSSRKDTTAFGGSSAKLSLPAPHWSTNFLELRWPRTRWGRSAKNKVECASPSNVTEPLLVVSPRALCTNRASISSTWGSVFSLMDSFLSQRNLLHLQQHKKFGVHAHTFVSQVMAPCEAITLPVLASTKSQMATMLLTHE